MKSDVILMLIGGLLLATGIIGGGFEVKEIKMPKVGKITRFFAIFSGGTLILVGLGMAISGPPAAPGDQSIPAATHAPAVAESPGLQQVHFYILDELGEGQVSEKVDILFDGRYVGNLKVDIDFPSDELALTAPAEGSYSYHIEAQATFYDEQSDTVFPYTGVGQGSIYVTEGAVFSLAGSFSGNNWAVTLVEEGGD